MFQIILLRVFTYVSPKVKKEIFEKKKNLSSCCLWVLSFKLQRSGSAGVGDPKKRNLQNGDGPQTLSSLYVRFWAIRVQLDFDPSLKPTRPCHETHLEYLGPLHFQLSLLTGPMGCELIFLMGFQIRNLASAKVLFRLICFKTTNIFLGISLVFLIS